MHGQGALTDDVGWVLQGQHLEAAARLQERRQTAAESLVYQVSEFPVEVKIDNIVEG